MIASVQLADVSVRTSFDLLRRAPKPGPGGTAGLLGAHTVLAAPLGGSVVPRPSLRRVGLIAFWSDDAALETFLARDPVAQALSGGWRVRLDPLRASGAWPGLPADTPATRAVDQDGPLVALTLGQLRISQAVRFLRVSNRAENAVLAAPGRLWSTGFARPPLVSSFSLWESTRALSTYAYGHGEPAHPGAITEGERKAFHQRQAFIRFRPYGVEGSLSGRNPLAEGLLVPV